MTKCTNWRLIYEQSRAEQSRVSIIVPVYNTEEYIERCVNSILSQTVAEFELLLIDDGSTDSSAIICEQLAKKDCRIRVIHKMNGGPGDARNMGLKIAKGEWICFVDSDDYLSRFYLEKLLKACENDGVLVSICNVTSDKKHYFNNYTSFMSNVLADNIGSQLWKFIFHKSLLEGISFPEKRFAEDAMVLPQILIRTNSISVIYEELYIYNYTNPNNVSNTDSQYLKNAVDRALMFIERYYWANNNNYFDAMQTILKKGAEFSVGVMGCYRRYTFEEFDILTIKDFLKNNIKEILGLHSLRIDRKIAVLIIVSNERLYYALKNLFV